jgi:hypothetical protein
VTAPTATQAPNPNAAPAAVNTHDLTGFEVYEEHREDVIQASWETLNKDVVNEREAINTRIDEIDALLTDPALTQDQKDELEAQKQEKMDSLWSDNSEEGARRAQINLGKARTRYAKAIAKRQGGTFVGGKELNSGWAKGTGEESINKDELFNNEQFKYEVLLGVSTKYQEELAEQSVVNGTPEEIAEAKKKAVLEALLGEEGKADANANGELFKLNNLVRDYRMTQSKVYEHDDNGAVVMNESGKPMAKQLRRAQQNLYSRWNRWSREGFKGVVKKAAVGVGIAAVSAVAVAGIVPTVVGGTLGAVLGGGLATRITKTFAVSKIEKGAALVKAQEEAAANETKYAELRADATASADVDRSHFSQIISKDFTHEANKQTTKNRVRFALGAVGVGAAVAGGELIGHALSGSSHHTSASNHPSTGNKGTAGGNKGGTTGANKGGSTSGNGNTTTGTTGSKGTTATGVGAGKGATTGNHASGTGANKGGNGNTTGSTTTGKNTNGHTTGTKKGATTTKGATTGNHASGTEKIHDLTNNHADVKSGEGYQQLIQDLARENGGKLNDQHSWDLYKALKGKFAGHLLTNDHSYAMPGGNYGISAPNAHAVWNAKAMSFINTWMHQHASELEAAKK